MFYNVVLTLKFAWNPGMWPFNAKELSEQYFHVLVIQCVNGAQYSWLYQSSILKLVLSWAQVGYLVFLKTSMSKQRSTNLKIFAMGLHVHNPQDTVLASVQILHCYLKFPSLFYTSHMYSSGNWKVSSLVSIVSNLCQFLL